MFTYSVKEEQMHSMKQKLMFLPGIPLLPLGRIDVSCLTIVLS